MTPDRVSWKVIERGWSVVDVEGADVGTVHEVLGDPNADIFSALVVSHGLLAKLEVPSEVVGEIVEGQVALTVAKDALEG